MCVCVYGGQGSLLGWGCLRGAQAAGKGECNAMVPLWFNHNGGGAHAAAHAAPSTQEPSRGVIHEAHPQCTQRRRHVSTPPRHMTHGSATGHWCHLAPQAQEEYTGHSGGLSNSPGARFLSIK